MNLSVLKSDLEEILPSIFSFSEKQTQVIIESVFATVIMDMNQMAQNTEDKDLERKVNYYVRNTLPEFIINIISSGLDTFTQSERNQLIPKIIAILERAQES